MSLAPAGHSAASPLLNIDLAKHDQISLSDGTELHVPNRQAQILYAIQTLPKPVMIDDVISRVWPAGDNGGLKQVSAVLLSGLRKRIQDHGLTVTWTKDRGYEVAALSNYA